MYVGVDYYPEHWPRERWETDALLMQQAGFNVVRLAEFAWVFMEPEEGRFEFGWLDDALEILGRHGISAILCTPTAVMPAWCARKYPETLGTRKEGQRIIWGMRKNNCFTSGTYRLLSERITSAMAAHYAGATNVIGWQTDNEFGHPVCFCDTCKAEFHDWLRAKYGSLDALNAAWGTHFWGHRYGEWAEIPLPDDQGTHNPSLCLDWRRFYSWLNVRFQRDQVRILRAACPGHFVTHNFMGLFQELNYYDLAEDLDHVSWDNYPVWGPPSVSYEAGLAADVMRGLKAKNFWIMEQTAGPGGWGSFGRTPYPGEIRKVAYQQVAHGADGMLWFRWRTCTAGREQYWHGLLQHDGEPRRRYQEAAQTATELHGLAEALAGTTMQADVAMIYDYDSIWALDIQPGFDKNRATDAFLRYYNALFRAGVNVDIVPPGADLSRYKAVFAPDLYVLPDALAEKLTAYVQTGGVLLTDCRTGVKDETSLCHARTLPGLLAAPLGIAIEEYESVPDGMEYAVVSCSNFPESCSAIRYIDWITPQGAEVLAGYTHWHLESFAAVTRNRFGTGTGFYVGTVVKEPSFYDELIGLVLKAAAITPPVTPPAGVEVSVRAGNGKQLLFLVNHTDQPQQVDVPAGHELLGGQQTAGTLTLERYGVAVVQLAKVFVG